MSIVAPGLLPELSSVGQSNASPEVAIRAWNLLTPFGNLTATWQGLLSGRALTDHGRVDDAPPTGRAAHLARVCAVQVAARGLDPDAALVIGTSKGPVENWLASPSEQEGGIDVTGLADIASRVGDCLGLRGPRLTISAACASGLQALIEGVMLIRSRQVTQALVVASESSLHPLFIGCFQRLGVLARPGRGCRPFDRQRDGFLMSEAAAAVLLEVVEPSRRHLDDERRSRGSRVVDHRRWLRLGRRCDAPDRRRSAGQGAADLARAASSMIGRLI